MYSHTHDFVVCSQGLKDAINAQISAMQGWKPLLQGSLRPRNVHYNTQSTLKVTQPSQNNYTSLTSI